MPSSASTADAHNELKAARRKLLRLVARTRRVGSVTLGATPRELILDNQGFRLYYYPGCAEAAAQRPLLIVYSLINRPSILDLSAKRSLIRAFRDRGRPTYLIEWKDPRPHDRFVSLDDYICDYIDRCADVLAERHPGRELDLLGVCQGGTFAVCYAALNPERIGKLITLVTPVDFHAGASTLYRLARDVDFERLTRVNGIISADTLNSVYVGLKPYQLFAQRYVAMLDMNDDEALADFLRMERWMYDSPDQTGAAFCQFARELYQENRLVRGSFELQGQRVDLARLTMPIRNVYAATDHLIPAPSAQALGSHCASKDYDELVASGGHLGVFVSGASHKRLLPALADWLNQPI